MLFNKYIRYPTFETWTQNLISYNKMCNQLPGLGCKELTIGLLWLRCWYCIFFIRFILNIDEYRITTGSSGQFDTVQYSFYRFLTFYQQIKREYYHWISTIKYSFRAYFLLEW